MNRIQRRLLCWLGVGLLAAACSGSDEPEAAPRPVISVFGQGTSPATVPAERDEVEVGRVDSGKVRGAESVVQNQRPHIRILSMEPSGTNEAAGSDRATWRAAVLAEDPDGDSLEIEYRWFVNGVKTEIEDEFYPTDSLKRGDRISVSARVFDGQFWSGSVRSREVEIGNILPSIVSVPPRPDATGFFRYLVGVEDTDDKKNLRFLLRKSPRGMQIGERSGEVTWRPGSDQAGRHEVEVVVRDGDGGEATQAFSLALVSVTESEQGPGPASPR
jgi:hypothetical protein